MLRRLPLNPLPYFAAVRLLVVAATFMSARPSATAAARSSTTAAATTRCCRCCCARCCPLCAGVRCVGTRYVCVACAGSRIAAWTNCSGIAANLAASANFTTAACAAAAGKAAVVGRISAAAAITAAAAVTKPVSAPAVAIAPTGPRAHAQEDAVVKVSWPIEAHGRTGVGRIVVIAVLANRLNTNSNYELRLCGRRHGQAREQCCSTEESFESAHN